MNAIECYEVSTSERKQPEGKVSTCNLLGLNFLQVSQDPELQEAGKLWPCTFSLADLIQVEFPGEGLRGKRVLELGAGTGALGIAVAARWENIEVVITDLEDVLPLLNTNLELNRASVSGAAQICVMEHRWGDEVSALGRTPDVLLACETLYWGGWDLLQDDTREALLKSFLSLSNANTKILVGFTIRDAKRELGFIRSCFEYFHCRLSQMMKRGLDEVDNGDEVLLVLTRIDGHLETRASGN
mmetsp:Transcript_17903/g.24762  ORF Transcript_17903/g.24762 Transcript_17903/m.24762 type:complete len:243 (+) Transcript_17903:77-805(+)